MRGASRSTLATAVFLTTAAVAAAQSSPATQATPDLNPRPPARGEIGQKPESPRPSPEMQPTAVTTPGHSPGAGRRGRSKRATPAPTAGAPSGTPTPAARIPAFRIDPRQPLFVVAAIGGTSPSPPGHRPWEERNTASWIVFGVLVVGLGSVTIRMLRYRRRLEIAALLRRLRRELRRDRRRFPRRDAAILKHP